MQTAMKTLCSGLVWAALVSLSYSAAAADHDTAPHAKDDLNNMQMDGEQLTMVKRAWNNMPQSAWGKRAWRNMPAAWGKRFADTDKRAWQKLQPMWGKRYGPEEEWSLVESSDNEPQYDDYGALPSGGEFEDLLDEDKRSWKSLNGGWGKRATHDWGSFRGSWGKRDPAWNNLKGLWGKRSIQDRISS